MSPDKFEEMEKAAAELHAKVYGNPEQEPVQKEEAPPEAKAEEPAPAPDAEPIKPLKAKDPEKENDPNYWKRRAEIMAGKYETEVPRYAEENRELKRKLAELEASKQEVPAPQQAAPQAAPPQDLIERYGEDFVRDIAKLMPTTPMPQSNAELAQLKAEIQRLKDDQAELAFGKFTETLANVAPSWEALNTDKEFNVWLDGIDMASGRPRRELFNDAVGRHDVQRTAHFFNSFGQQNQSWAEPPQAQVPPAEHFMAPQNSKAQQAPQSKKLWSAPEISQFYEDVRKGRVTEDVAARIEADIFAAQREGRIR